MKTKTKWIGAGALVAVGIGIVVLRSGQDAPKPESVEGPVARPSSPSALRDEKRAAPPPPLPDAVAMVQRKRAPPAPRVMPYRPAKLLIYSESAPAMEPSGDESSAVLRRILDVTAANPGQAERIRELWRVHEDGRRELWAQSFDRKSGPRILDPRQVARLDAEFETGIVANVLTTEQSVRMLAETGRMQP